MKPTTKKNPQENSILEQMHQVVANMLWSYDLNNQKLDEIDPFGEYLTNIVWAICCTYHITLEVLPN